MLSSNKKTAVLIGRGFAVFIKTAGGWPACVLYSIKNQADRDITCHHQRSSEVLLLEIFIVFFIMFLYIET